MSATDDRTFADVRPLFDAWHTAQRADRPAALPTGITPAMRDARVLALAGAVDRALTTLREQHPDVEADSPLGRALIGVLFRTWLDALQHHRSETGPYWEMLIGAYLPHAPAGDLAAFGRFADFLRGQGIEDTDD